MNAEDIVVDLVALNGGELVGRTRMQKQAYLLDRCGAEFGLLFIYHHYGPYCFDLAGAMHDAKAERRIEAEERSGRHGVPYTIFRSKNGAGYPATLGSLDAQKARALLERMKQVSDIVLELAATIVFLRDDWDYFDKPRTTAVQETKARKSLKATDERIAKALKLLCDLDLHEQAEPATP